MRQRKIKEIMTTGVVTCNPDSSLDEVARLLSEAEISAVVVGSAEGKLEGILSSFDLLQYFGKDLSQIRAVQIMRRDVASVLPTDLVEVAAQKMQEAHYHRLVVTNEDKSRAVGVISISDVIRTMWRDPDALIEP